VIVKVNFHPKINLQLVDVLLIRVAGCSKRPNDHVDGMEAKKKNLRVPNFIFVQILLPHREKSGQEIGDGEKQSKDELLMETETYNHCDVITL